MNEKIRDVDKMAEEVLKDKELWEAINDKIMEKNLENLKMAYAHEEGKAEGLKEGEKEKAKEIAKNLLGKGIDINTIIEVTKLTKEEIEKL